MVRYQLFASPIGDLRLAETDRGLTAILFDDQSAPANWRKVEALESDIVDQLEAYFTGELREFDLSLAPDGSQFQQRVWDAVREIPHGETRSYLEIAVSLGDPAAVRAVGAANGRNPLPIVVPCHRVVGSDGSLTGYAGGVDRKRRLLELEQPRKYGPGPLFRP